MRIFSKLIVPNVNYARLVLHTSCGHDSAKVCQEVSSMRSFAVALIRP